MTDHDIYRLDSGFEGVDCPLCKGDGCGECFEGEVHPTHRKELLTELRAEL